MVFASVVDHVRGTPRVLERLQAAFNQARSRADSPDEDDPKARGLLRKLGAARRQKGAEEGQFELYEQERKGGAATSHLAAEAGVGASADAEKRGAAGTPC